MCRRSARSLAQLHFGNPQPSQPSPAQPSPASPLLRRPMAKFAGRSWRAGGGWAGLDWAGLAADVRLAGGCQLWLGESSFANSGGETLSDNMILHIKCAESRYCLCTIDIVRQYLHNAYLLSTVPHSLKNKTSMQFHTQNCAQ